MSLYAVKAELPPSTILRRKDAAASIYDLDSMVCTRIAQPGINMMVLNINYN
jgi:hypothetical protein